jgi:hypothetical protein
LYCIDTSAVLDGWSRYYPPDVFESLWQNLEDLIRRQGLHSPDEVLIELSKKLDDAYAWAKKQEGMFVDLDDDVQDATTEILAAYPRLVKADQLRTSADPFVIGLAKVRGLIVITGENVGSDNRPKILYVCAQLGIPCINMVGLMRAQGWTFRR